VKCVDISTFASCLLSGKKNGKNSFVGPVMSTFLAPGDDVDVCGSCGVIEESSPITPQLPHTSFMLSFFLTEFSLPSSLLT